MKVQFCTIFLIAAAAGSSTEREASCRYIFHTFPQVKAPSSYSLSAIEGGQLETLDGSIWRLSEYDQRQASYWLAEEPLLITQNGSWFSPHPYRIVNRERGSSVEADLISLPPSLRITEIDPVRAQVGLSDRTAWQVFPEDLPLLAEWTLEEPVAIGFNSGEGENFDAILINGAAKNHIRTTLK
jgi:hypothetical protein